MRSARPPICIEHMAISEDRRDPRGGAGSSSLRLAYRGRVRRHLHARRSAVFQDAPATPEDRRWASQASIHPVKLRGMQETCRRPRAGGVSSVRLLCFSWFDVVYSVSRRCSKWKSTLTGYRGSPGASDQGSSRLFGHIEQCIERPFSGKPQPSGVRGRGKQQACGCCGVRCLVDIDTY